ncbi:succinylglutamate desuccinylase/aspartoacylase family protein [Jiangella gansuensis]|uniref:succinylglutamate desuccinylase/aspartoacylase family protein n=1 Tax=Jiangella gansuensis TaxID=281473 RepID=UPI0004B42C91|nr:succinylglutamate desuccinylase/aspartoacylase family protein [Jiangella gansuensis]
MQEPQVNHRSLAGGVVLTTVTGQSAGPTLALLGGVHGDEDEGVLAVRLVLSELRGLPLRGTVRAVAVANPPAWDAHSRTSPLDGGNLARSFPGDPADGPTAAIAAAVTAEVIEGSDALVDLHSAGIRYRMPLLAGYCADGPAGAASERLAVAFGAPVVWRHPASAPGRSLSVAAQAGIPAIYAECSGGGSIRAHELDTYVAGVLRVLAELGMLPSSGDRPAPPRWVHGQGDLDTGAAAGGHGFFVSSVRAGDVVRRGEEIGRFHDHDGESAHPVVAPGDGMVMFLRRQARTATEDVLFVLAGLDGREEAGA